MMKRLYRSKKDRMVGGVCGGLGEYADIDPALIRIFLVILIVFSWGMFLLIYIIAWIIVPPAPDDYPLTGTDG
ncbi:MAG: PspC domain-containing protein [Methanomicrobiales archaeon HGW-Methanomicrobiales-3]|nr:MAG: PspC domain-containing protein [Methanomicrobiales archaeon HGW-Methanomicrobiales-3]